MLFPTRSTKRSVWKERISCKPRNLKREKPEEVKASHILISYKGADRADAKVTRSKEEAKAEAEKIRKQIVEDGQISPFWPPSIPTALPKPKAGTWANSSLKSWPSLFRSSLRPEVGAVSEVVETGFGFHVIKRTE